VLARLDAAEDFAHEHDQLQGAFVADAVVHTVGVLARLQYPLVAQDGEVLRDVALRCAHRLDDVLHALFATAEHAQDLEAQGVRDCLERARGRFDVLMLVDERGDVVFVHDGAGSGKAIV